MPHPVSLTAMRTASPWRLARIAISPSSGVCRFALVTRLRSICSTRPASAITRAGSGTMATGTGGAPVSVGIDGAGDAGAAAEVGREDALHRVRDVYGMQLQHQAAGLRDRQVLQVGDEPL